MGLIIFLTGAIEALLCTFLCNLTYTHIILYPLWAGEEVSSDWISDLPRLPSVSLQPVTLDHFIFNSDVWLIPFKFNLTLDKAIFIQEWTPGHGRCEPLKVSDLKSADKIMEYSQPYHGGPYLSELFKFNGFYFHVVAIKFLSVHLCRRGPDQGECGGHHRVTISRRRRRDGGLLQQTEAPLLHQSDNRTGAQSTVGSRHGDVHVLLLGRVHAAGQADL